MEKAAVTDMSPADISAALEAGPGTLISPSCEGVQINTVAKGANSWLFLSPILIEMFGLPYCVLIMYPCHHGDDNCSSKHWKQLKPISVSLTNAE